MIMNLMNSKVIKNMINKLEMLFINLSLNNNKKNNR